MIVGVGDKMVDNTNEASRAIRQSLKDSQAVALRIVRNGESIFVAVSPGPAGGDDNNSDNSDDGNG